MLVALRRNTAFLQREVASRLGLKFAPRLKFLGDDSFDEAERIERLLADPRVTRDLGDEGGDGGGETGADTGRAPAAD